MAINKHQVELALYRMAVTEMNQIIAATRELIEQSIALLRIAEAMAMARLAQSSDQNSLDVNTASWGISSYTELLRERAARLFGLALRAGENGFPDRVSELTKLAHELLSRAEALDGIAAG